MTTLIAGQQVPIPQEKVVVQICNRDSIVQRLRLLARRKRRGLTRIVQACIHEGRSDDEKDKPRQDDEGCDDVQRDPKHADIDRGQTIRGCAARYDAGRGIVQNGQRSVRQVGDPA